MVRKGWKTVETPSGRYNVIRLARFRTSGQLRVRREAWVPPPRRWSFARRERERDRALTTPSPGHIKDHELNAIRLSALKNKNKKEDGSRGPTC